MPEEFASASRGSPFDGLDSEFLKMLWRLTFDIGGPHGSKAIRDEGTIDWVVSGIQSAGSAGEPIWAVAGQALHRIVSHHPFMECNHRTGWLLCRTLMQADGFHLVLPSVDVIRFVKSIDADSLDEEAVREWVRQAFLHLG